MTNIKVHQFESEGPLQNEMIQIVSKKSDISKKGRGEPGTLTGVYVNFLYFWAR